MPKATYILPDGVRVELEIESGTSLMRAAVSHGIQAIVGDCGGSASCATCHIYVDESYLHRLPPIGEDEEAMLEGTAAERRSVSRLSCQLAMSDALDGILVRVPDRQW